MTKTLLAFAAMILTLNTSAYAYSNADYSSEGEAELTDILSPEELEADILESGDLGDEIDLTPTAGGARLKIVVSKSSQYLEVFEDGVKTMGWKVSTGAKGYDTPVGTFTVKRMHYTYTSKKYRARMDRAIFFHGGYALHQTYGKNIDLLGTRQSHGCVRQSPENGDKLFSLVKQYGAGSTLVQIKN